MSDPVREMRDLLDAAGRREVPPPDAAFADALETRLAAVAATLPATDALPARVTRRRRVGLGLGAALAATALVIALLPGLLPAQPQPAGRAQLGEPHNVAVTLPDGSVLEDPGGLLLPLGAVVDVGPGGSARIGDLELRAGDSAVVTEGGLTITRANGAVETPPLASTPPGGGGSDRPARPSSSPAPAPTDGASASAPAVTPSPTTEPSGSATASVTPRPTPTATPVSPDASATPKPTPSPTPLVLRPRLRVALITGPRIAVTWSATWGADHYLLVVTRSRGGAAADPAYPGGLVLAEFAAPPSPRFRFRVPLGVTEVRLMVVAVRADGSVIRRSLVEVVAVPPAASPTPTPVPVVAPTPTP